MFILFVVWWRYFRVEANTHTYRQTYIRTYIHIYIYIYLHLIVYLFVYLATVWHLHIEPGPKRNFQSNRTRKKYDLQSAVWPDQNQCAQSARGKTEKKHFAGTWGKNQEAEGKARLRRRRETPETSLYQMDVGQNWRPRGPQMLV